MKHTWHSVRISDLAERIVSPMTEPKTDSPPKPSRAEASRQRRSARAIAAENQKKKSTVRWAVIAVAALILIGAGVLIYNQVQQQSAAGPPEGTVSYTYTGAQHSNDPVTYSENPPVGGVHNPTWQNCGYYPAPVPNENAVHSLEHGAIWITYQPDLPQDQVEILRNLAESQSYILVSPMEGIPTPVVASAWNQQIQLDSATDERLDQFIRAFRLGQGNAPEPGAACAGGSSLTL
jgi:hypothetical protein